MSFRNRFRFEHQIAALVGLLCLALVGATVTGAVWLERRSALALAEARLARLAAGMAESLDATLRERFREIQVLAGLEPLRERWGGDPTAIRGVLSAIRTTAPDYAWLGFVAPDGRVRVGTEGMLEGLAMTGRAWFETGLTRPNVGDVHEASLLNRLLVRAEPEPLRLVDLAAPVRDPAGHVIGVLGGHLSWDWAIRVRRRFLDEGLSGTDLWVLDRRGRVILGPHLGATPFGPGRVGAMVEQGSGRFAAAIGGETLLAGFASAAKGERSEIAGGDPGLGWLVVATRPEAQVLAPVRRSVEALMGLGAAVAMIGVALALCLGRRAAAPLRRMTAAADRIGRDADATTLPRLDGSREFVALSAALRSLLRRIGTAERELNDVAARSTRVAAFYRRQIEDLRQVAGTDALTGLLNRRGFAAPAEDAFAQARSGRCGIAVLVVDIDHFKHVNDQNGHDAGDAVIRHVGALLAEAVRSTDTVARFGGEEFVVLLVGLGGPEAALIAERLCAAVRAAEIPHAGGTIPVTVSIGVATLSPRDPDIQAAIARADAALYEAKARGRDRISVAATAEAVERAA
ncbi:sensor domain-containing diguanylate cyclase [Methylobacterium nonmethylotrophicum]|uniref:diguanylate cyclase n=1 Tax=Methylobacterium nonmethylotrophicum TaxID=1141884 RepID=A0A4Z0NK23_9HYPH|nr:sensor domain-containing diguanylate cyclase [Methylobacterium nonmethylotrophicum]TGD96723.1 diguanylate cyclase [Methylobacterium nonmethylotrophicum]